MEVSEKKAEFVAKFDHEAELEIELSFKSGDIIRDVKPMKGGWWEGSINSRRGLFPDNFVHKKICRVLFNYVPQHRDELKLKSNDFVEFWSDIEDGWCKGKLRGRVGVFPSNYVEFLSNNYENNNYKTIQNKTFRKTKRIKTCDFVKVQKTKEKCIVLSPYEAANKDELTLQEGQIITIVTKVTLDKGWWKGELGE